MELQGDIIQSVHSLTDVFADLRILTNKHATGLYTGRLKKHCATPRPACFPKAQNASWSPTLIIKVRQTLENVNLRHGTSGHTETFRSWVGERNSVREMAMGKLLNSLVVHRITPHMPHMYTCYHVQEDGLHAFVMEQMAMSFHDFMAVNAQVPLLDVALLQICQGLLSAQKHVDFRHNDLHTQNVMMSHVQSGTYTYKVGSSFYRIPNHGMCWKVIDFGMASSRLLDRNDVPHAAMHSPALSVAHRYFDLSGHAAELFDVLRLVTSAKHVCKSEAVIRRLDEFVNLLHGVAMTSDKSGSLQYARDRYVANANRKTEPLLVTTPTFSLLMASSGLLERVFHMIARRYKVNRPRGNNVFDSKQQKPFSLTHTL